MLSASHVSNKMNELVMDPRRPSSSMGSSVRQIMNACAHVVNGIRKMKHACSNGLLTDNDITKVQYASKCCLWAESVYEEMKSKGGSSMEADTLLEVLLKHESDYTQAIAALSGPHVSLISTIKYNAHILTSKKGKKKRKDPINVTLGKALKAVNYINSVWYAMTHFNEFFWDMIRAMPDTPEEEKIRSAFSDLRDRTSSSIKQAQLFSDNARMKIAEESLKRNFVIPSSKLFKSYTKEYIFGNASVLRSEVVFRVEGKFSSKVSKKQPLRLSIVGEHLILTISSLKSETLAMQPKDVASIRASIPKDSDDQFALIFSDGTQPIVLRAKVPSQRDRWVNFFANLDSELQKLQAKVENFEDELAKPTHPMLAQRPSMAEISLFNQARKQNLSATVAWDDDEELDGNTEGISSNQVFVTLGDIYDGPSSDTVPDMHGYCTPHASRSATPQQFSNSRSTTPTTFGRAPTPLRQATTPTRSWVTFNNNNKDNGSRSTSRNGEDVHQPFTSDDEDAAVSPRIISPTRSITSTIVNGNTTTTFSAVNATCNNPNITAPKPSKPTPSQMQPKNQTLC
eukprot:m.134743 g.134743  ORF g.134743 m.134743 type:complete len:570 (+) comp9716_c0_seq1:136-1845(+)